MNFFRTALLSGIAGAILGTAHPIAAQKSFLSNYESHNQNMAALQPSWMTPLVTSDARIVQFYRVAVSHQFAPAGTPTYNFGNNRGLGLISGNRVQISFMPPAYIEHNSSAEDGSGDTIVGATYRILSGNAQHGNFAFSAILNHSFATGSYKNGASTQTYLPALAGGKAFGKFDAQSSLGATLPTGKVELQGRPVAWNTAFQYHALPKIWVEVEDNATFYNGSSHDGMTQNCVTPAIFLGKLRKKEWKPTHPFFLVDGGMQIATSHFHTMNHNLIMEAKVIF